MIGTTQNRLSTGLAVSSAMDDAVKYFQAKSLNSRAQDLSERKDAIDQGVSTLEAALKATDAMENLVQRMKGLIDAARSQTDAQRAGTKNQLFELYKQVENLVQDASYNGLNLLNDSNAKLTVRFSDKADSKIEVDGVAFQDGGYFVRGVAGADPDAGGPLTGAVGEPVFLAAPADADAFLTGIGFTSDLDAYSDQATFDTDANNAVLNLEATVNNIRAKTATMATNADILKVRLDFTKDYVSVLQGGADKLTLADLNEEGANLLALQTRQQIGIQALSFAGQSEQSVLSLFR
jgi:flagellin-like hook-associated protein FlgL